MLKSEHESPPEVHVSKNMNDVARKKISCEVRRHAHTDYLIEAVICRRAELNAEMDCIEFYFSCFQSQFRFHKVNASIIIQEILVSEATHEEGLELSLGQEGWLRLEAGSKICGSAHSQCKDFS